MDQERTIEFILEQQAKFFAGLEESRQQITELGQKISQFAEQQAEINQQQAHINTSLGKAMLGLTDHVEKLIAAQSNTDDRLKALITAQSHTDERLNALIEVVDGVIRRPPAPPQ